MSRAETEVASRSLDEQRAEFARRRGLAMPLAGLIAWSVVGIGGATLPPTPAVWLLFGATGSIAYLGMFISRFTGENFLDRSKPRNVFDSLFLHTVAAAGRNAGRHGVSRRRQAALDEPRSPN